MKKTIIISLIAASILSTGLFAEDLENNTIENVKTVFINSETIVGDKILSDEKAYSKYLQDKAISTAIQDKRNNQVKQNCSDIAKLKKAVAKLIKEVSYIEPVKPKVNCKTSYIKKFDKKSIKGSYFVLSPNKEFTVVRSNTHSYKYPVLNLEKENSFKIGKKFIGDLYTRAGWVHVKNGDWIKGYKVNPPIKYYKSNKSGKNSSSFIEEKIVTCEENK